MFTGVLVIEKCGQIFTGELELCSEDSIIAIIIGGELCLAGNRFSHFSTGFACSKDSIIIGGELFLGGNSFSNFSPGLACL